MDSCVWFHKHYYRLKWCLIVFFDSLAVISTYTNDFHSLSFLAYKNDIAKVVFFHNS